MNQEKPGPMNNGSFSQPMNNATPWVEAETTNPTVEAVPAASVSPWEYLAQHFEGERQ